MAFYEVVGRVLFLYIRRGGASDAYDSGSRSLRVFFPLQILSRVDRDIG